MTGRFPRRFAADVLCGFCGCVYPTDLYDAAPDVELESCGWHTPATDLPADLGVCVEEIVKIDEKVM